MYKFRSMTNERGEDGYLLPEEKRLTKFGHFIRKTSIDELLGLFNISQFLELKITAMKKFTTQIASYPNPCSEEAIRVLAMFRGSNVGLHAAEAFVLK